MSLSLLLFSPSFPPRHKTFNYGKVWIRFMAKMCMCLLVWKKGTKYCFELLKMKLVRLWIQPLWKEQEIIMSHHILIWEYFFSPFLPFVLPSSPPSRLPPSLPHSLYKTTYFILPLWIWKPSGWEMSQGLGNTVVPVNEFGAKSEICFAFYCPVW